MSDLHVIFCLEFLISRTHDMPMIARTHNFWRILEEVLKFTKASRRLSRFDIKNFLIVPRFVTVHVELFIALDKAKKFVRHRFLIAQSWRKPSRMQWRRVWRSWLLGWGSLAVWLIGFNHTTEKKRKLWRRWRTKIIKPGNLIVPVDNVMKSAQQRIIFR